MATIEKVVANNAEEAYSERYQRRLEIMDFLRSMYKYDNMGQFYQDVDYMWKDFLKQNRITARHKSYTTYLLRKDNVQNKTNP